MTSVACRPGVCPPSPAMDGIVVTNPKTDRNGNDAPSHHISNLTIIYQGSEISRSWDTYSKSEFAKNTVRFVREYQKSLLVVYPANKDQICLASGLPSEICATGSQIYRQSSQTMTPEIGHTSSSNGPVSAEKERDLIRTRRDARHTRHSAAT
jgi:hypothetical protein